LRPIEEQGYLVVAVNANEIDYVSCAQRLMQTVKHWHPAARTCLITDQPYEHPVFDHVRILPAVDRDNVYANDAQAFRLTPFRETIKLEADMLMVSDCSHWWNMLRHRDLVISVGCRTWQDRVSSSQHYRRAFVENSLPDVYNAITYWRLSETARNFFRWVKIIFSDWGRYRRLIKYPEAVPSTDLVYAMAAQIVGPEQVTLPFAAYPRMVHMKQHHAGTVLKDWSQELVWEYHDHRLRINTVAQWGAFHYHVKHWQP
jgi:hypothetical protein